MGEPSEQRGVLPDGAAQQSERRARRQKRSPLVDQREARLVTEHQRVTQLELARATMAHQVDPAHVSITQVPLPDQKPHVAGVLRALDHAAIVRPANQGVGDLFERGVEAAGVADDDEVERRSHFASR